jgi:hypothetical protein
MISAPLLLSSDFIKNYQYLGMTKIAGALNMLPKTMLRHNITNPSNENRLE